MEFAANIQADGYVTTAAAGNILYDLTVQNTTELTGNVGIGKAPSSYGLDVLGAVYLEASLLVGTTISAGAGGFTVDATGDITAIRSVPYVFPSANTSGVLTNDGSGNLSWTSSAVGNSLKSNLKVSITTSPTVNITADLLSVQGVILAPVSTSATLTSSGAGGLDTGSPAANTWYAVHVITNNTGSVTNGLFSLSSSAPTLPSGYTKFRRVGWARYNGTPTLYLQIRNGDIVYYGNNGNSGSTGLGVILITDLNLAIPTSAQVYSLASWIPPGASVGKITAVAYATNGGGGYLTVGPGTAGAGGLNPLIGVGNTGTSGGMPCMCQSDVQIDANQAIFAETANLQDIQVGVIGYFDPV